MLETGTQIKSAAAEWPIGFRFHGEDLEGLAIVGVVVSAIPSGLVISDPIINAEADGFYSWVSGGTAGEDYLVTFVWTRSDGMVTDDIMRVCVR